MKVAGTIITVIAAIAYAITWWRIRRLIKSKMRYRNDRKTQFREMNLIYAEMFAAPFGLGGFFLKYDLLDFSAFSGKAALLILALTWVLALLVFIRFLFVLRRLKR